MKNIILWASLVLLAPMTLAGETLPADVKKFVINAETCIHFSGEWDETDKVRQKEITDAVEKYCKCAKKERAILKKKYKSKTKIQEELEKYEVVDSVLDN